MGKMQTIIPPPGEGREPIAVAKEVLELMRGGYCWNIRMLAELFCAERQYIEDNFKPNVRHICINKFFGQYMIEHLEMSEREVQLIRHGRYFFQEADLQRFWQENARAGRKTGIVDLAQYRKNGVSVRELASALNKASTPSGNRKAREEEKNRLQAMLTEEGQRFLALRGKKEAEWLPEKLPELPLHSFPKPESCAELMAKSGGTINSTSVAFQHMYAFGALHISFLGGKTLWLYEHKLPNTAISVPAGVLQDTKQMGGSKP